MAKLTKKWLMPLPEKVRLKLSVILYPDDCALLKDAVRVVDEKNLAFPTPSPSQLIRILLQQAKADGITKAHVDAVLQEDRRRTRHAKP